MRAPCSSPVGLWYSPGTLLTNDDAHQGSPEVQVCRSCAPVAATPGRGYGQLPLRLLVVGHGPLARFCHLLLVNFVFASPPEAQT